MHVNDEKVCTCTFLNGAACIGDWGRANLCKGLNVPLCFIPLMQILFPYYIEINYIDIKKKKNLKKKNVLCHQYNSYNG